MTAGIAATRPMAVAISASAMPGATTASEAEPVFPMPSKAVMMPHTVPNRPINGDVDPVALHDVFSFGNKLIAIAHNLLNGVNLQDPLTGLRVVRAGLLRNWQIKSKGFDIEVELNSFIERSGYATVEIPIHYRQRIGEKKLKISDGASILKRIVLESTY